MNIRQRFEELAPRERRLVYLAGGFVAAAAIYFIIVMPLQAYSSRAASRVAQKTADLAWMQQVAPQVMAAGATGGGADPASRWSFSSIAPRARLASVLRYATRVRMATTDSGCASRERSST